MQKFENLDEIIKATNNFNFDSLTFYKGFNPIFLNTESGNIESYTPDTDIDIAERQNPVVWIGNLTEREAKEGKNPFGEFEQERAELYLGFKC